MRFQEQWTQGCGVSPVKCFDGAFHALVFCNDVAAAGKHLGRQDSTMSFQLRKCDITKRANLRESRP
jgi:hypothetical protein